MSASVAEIEAARHGDPVAIGRLLAAHRPNIRRYAQRSCWITVVDDAVQETLLILSRSIGQLRHAAAFSSWVFNIARRECRRLSRAALRIDIWDENRVDAWMGAHAPSALRLDVAAAIESLPQDAREVLVLRDFEELTIDEIAERLHITRAATKSRLHRARSLAREYLVGEDSRGNG